MFEKVIELVPDDYTAYYRLGDIYYHKRQYDNALTFYQKIFDLGLEADLAYFNNEIGRCYSDLGKTKEAEAHFRKALGLSSEEPRFKYFLATELKNQARWDEALEILEKLLDEAPEDRMPLVHDMVGRIYSEKKEYEKAILYWNKLVEIEPDVETYVALSLSYYELNQYREAIEVGKKALHLEPGMHTLWRNLGVYHDALKEYDKAITYYIGALGLKNIESTNVDLSKIFYKKSDLDRAIEYALRAISLNDKSIPGYDMLGASYFRNGNTEAGLEAFKKALSLEEHSTDSSDYEHIVYILTYFEHHEFANEVQEACTRVENRIRQAE